MVITPSVSKPSYERLIKLFSTRYTGVEIIETIFLNTEVVLDDTE
jgi:hypothetical protein